MVDTTLGLGGFKARRLMSAVLTFVVFAAFALIVAMPLRASAAFTEIGPAPLNDVNQTT